eukprot:Phypoly_transcript_14259.p1 GENE.Phypoly_transcript_14259~~Phypoly_transcript_14259.p1  ORF type:complete len:306 (+),score=42.87 Phypoly_transcript_14259:49-966(+)
MFVGKLFFIVGVVVPLCYAASKTIQFGDLAVTLIPPTLTLGLAPLHINDPFQEWIIPTTSTGYISSGHPDYAIYVWDVRQSDTSAGASVISYPKQSVINPNQQWKISENGEIKSALAQKFTVTHNSSNLYMTYFTPADQATFADPLPPWTCSSEGDPLIRPYPGDAVNLYPTFQAPGTFTLSKTGVSVDPDFLQISADQQLCQPNVPGAYCNQRGMVQTAGHVIIVAGDTVTIDGVVTPVTGTVDMGNRLSVTKLGTGNYVARYTTGKTQFQTVQYSKYSYMNIFITVTGGRIPTGGLCTTMKKA